MYRLIKTCISVPLQIYGIGSDIQIAYVYEILEDFIKIVQSSDTKVYETLITEIPRPKQESIKSYNINISKPNVLKLANTNHVSVHFNVTSCPVQILNKTDQFYQDYRLPRAKIHWLNSEELCNYRDLKILRNSKPKPMIALQHLLLLLLH